jgi:glycosyltransferase involved in cell wall biosynthesis
VNRRILLLITDLEIGGTPTVVRELAVRLNAPPEVHVEVACLAGPGPVGEQLREAGIEVTALGARGVWDARILWRFVKLVREHRIDTVFSFLVHANVVAAKAAMVLRDVRFIQSIQTTQPSPRWHWRVTGIVQEMAERIAVPSESVAEKLDEWSHVSRDKIAVIPNAVDVNEFRDTGLRPVRPAHGPEARVTVGFLGRLDPVKRVPDLVEAICELDHRFDLHVFGDGADRKRIEATIVRLNLRDRVTLHGQCALPQAAIAQMDVLVLPSEAEGFGLVLIEAMAARVPVVATDVPGICDVVKNEETGLLVPVASPDKLAGAIRRVAEDDALRKKLTDAAYADVQRRFSWPAVLAQYRGVLGLEQK